MNSKKLWHTFALLFLYLCFVAVFTHLFASLSATLRLPWGVAFGVGVAVWIFALVCLIAREKVPVFELLALPCTAVACSLWLCAFTVGKGLAPSLSALLLLAVLTSLCYLLFMLLMSLPTVSEYLSYQITTFVVWLVCSILILVFLCEGWLALFGKTLPAQGWFVTFLSILLGFLSLGSLLEVEDFKSLCLSCAVPMLVATGIIGLFVLLLLSSGDSCDCGDACDCGDLSSGNGKRKSTKRYTSTSHSTYQNLSKGNQLF